MHCIKKGKILFLLIIFFYGCNSNPLDVDASHIKVKLNYINVDSTYINSNKTDRLSYHNMYKKRIGGLYKRAYRDFISIDFSSDSAFLSSIAIYYSDPYVFKLQKEIKKMGSFNKEKKSIHKAFQHLRYHFPNGQTPKNIVFLTSFFAHRNPVVNQDIGVSLECYLNPKLSVIKELPKKDFPQYYKNEMNRRYLVRDLIQQWIMHKYIKKNNGVFSEKMVYWGKVLYLTRASLPYIDPSIICRYSVDDYNWATKEEEKIWKFLVDNEILFKKNDLTDRSWFNEAPFTIGLDNKSPQRLGQYMGFKMVMSFMEKNKDLPIKNLVTIPYTQIMQEYKIALNL